MDHGYSFTLMSNMLYFFRHNEPQWDNINSKHLYRSSIHYLSAVVLCVYTWLCLVTYTMDHGYSFTLMSNMLCHDRHNESQWDNINSKHMYRSFIHYLNAVVPCVYTWLRLVTYTMDRGVFVSLMSNMLYFFWHNESQWDDINSRHMYRNFIHYLRAVVLCVYTWLRPVTYTMDHG